jgi:Zn-dependent peptidase ImmA (M78 family)/transcriptional regulator with XRE-family HTH domain
MINGDRVRQAREIKGLTQAELADGVKVSQSTIAHIENNSQQLLLMPSERIVEAIAFQTGFPLQFFYQESAPEFPLGSLLYRNRRSLIKKDEKGRFHQLGRLVYEIAEKMSHELSFPNMHVPRVENETPQVAAKIARAKLGLSPDSPVKNLLNQLEKNGVFIFTLPYEIDEQDAFSVWADTEPRRPVLILCGIKSGDRQRFSLAHEFGHLVMHYSFPDGLKKVEKEADEFAAEFLMPEEAMRREIIAPVSLTSLAELKPRWGVSISALMLRARDLDIISERQWKYLNKQKRDLKWDKKEPENLYIKPEKPRAFKKMAEVLHGLPVAASKVASYNYSPVRLINEILEAHADKPEMPKKETTIPIQNNKVVSIFDRKKSG